MQVENVWSEKTIVYHIYVRSFKDSNQDGVGDLNGILEKLNYLNDDTQASLGIDAIWLSPIYPSPQADFGYDVSDYQDIDPIYGNREDFKNLLSEAHNRGIKVMMDFVPNHTSSLHHWFQESKSSKDNPMRDFYLWAPPGENGGPPNNWLSVFGGSGWEFDENSGEYYFHTFDVGQPDLNWRNLKVIQAMLNVLRFWLDLGVDGFRVDAIEWIFKDAEMRDEPDNPQSQMQFSDPYQSLVHKYTYASEEVIGIIREFVEILEQYQDKFLVTEVWQPMEEVVKLYEQIGKKWFTPFNFGLITNPWNAKVYKDFIDQYDSLVGALYFPTYVLGSHDKPRVTSRIGREQAKIAAILLLTLRGMPYIYYGEEIGMTDTQIKFEDIQDPFEKKSPGLGLGRDPERTPMQWNGQSGAGFSSARPWLPLNKNLDSVNVESEAADPKSILNLYKKLIDLRKKSPALLYGKYDSHDAGNDNVFAFTREHETDTILIVLNYSSKPQTISLPFSPGKVLVTTHMEDLDPSIDFKNLVLKPDEGIIFQL